MVIPFNIIYVTILFDNTYAHKIIYHAANKIAHPAPANLLMSENVTSSGFLIILSTESASFIFSMKWLVMDPPDAHDDAVYRLPHQCHSGELSTKRAHQSKPTASDFYIIGRELQNRSGKGLDWISPKRTNSVPFLVPVPQQHFKFGTSWTSSITSIMKHRSSTSFGPSYSWKFILCKMLPVQQLVVEGGNQPQDSSQICMANDWSHCKFGATCCE